MTFKRILTYFLGGAILLSASGCFVAENPYSSLPPGIWRAVLKLDSRPVSQNPKGEPLPDKVNLKFEEVTDGELPFLFEVKYVTPDSFYLEIINGEERIVVTDIHMGRTKYLAKDTFRIDFPVFDSYIHGLYEENVMEGEWVVLNRGDNYRIPFVAKFGQGHRFTTLRKTPAIDLTGRWEVTFGLVEGEEPYPAIADFVQQGNELTGTFMTETGDYRYLEGTVQANKVYLSVFDGSHAFLFEAKIQPDSTLVGSFRSGRHYQTLWQAKRNSAAKLRDPDSITWLKPGMQQFDFQFPNTSGKMVSLSDPAYAGKIKLVQIMGTWCPNCRDETMFLLNFLKEKQNPDLAVIALAFERQTTQEKAFHAINTYRDRLQIPYEVLWAGSSDKAEAAKSLPMLNQIYSFPTLIIVDKENRVRRIHTGFAGPATEAYKSFTQEFSAYIEELSEPASVQ
ncbi:MAG: TlpA family protein disulfide reductase [Lewinellaceae bacterium]|nr:TlpA family protein disulfide reductase [Lewinellaceae bacterium]